MKILHVADCAGGGVPRAIVTIAHATPTDSHHVLWNEANEDDEAFRSVRHLPRAPRAAIAAIRGEIRRVLPDVIHAHSSIAGVYTRVIRTGMPVLYQPHCYAFEDVGRPAIQRIAFRAAETALARRAAGVVALTEHERRLASGMARRTRVHVVPNCPTISVERHGPACSPTPSVVVMAGRIGRQKDPAFFAEVARSVRFVVPSARFVWIGDGDATGREMLESAGVEVTGWLDTDGVTEALRRGSLYLHSAAHEGFPLSVLDACAAGLPVVVRAIPPFDGSGLFQVQNSDEAASTVTRALLERPFQAELVDASSRLLEVMNADAQRIALRNAYRDVREMSAA